MKCVGIKSNDDVEDWVCPRCEGHPIIWMYLGLPYSEHTNLEYPAMQEIWPGLALKMKDKEGSISMVVQPFGLPSDFEELLFLHHPGGIMEVRG